MPATHAPRSASSLRSSRLRAAVGLATFIGATLLDGLLAHSASAATVLAADANDVQLDTSSLEQLTQGLAWYALVMCMVGICISASLWAIGSKGQNPGQELTGKKGLILCCTAAFFVGSIGTITNYLYKEAQTMDKAGVTKTVPNDQQQPPEKSGGQ